MKNNLYRAPHGKVCFKFLLFVDDPMWENDGCKTKPAISPNLLGGQALFTQALHPNAIAHIPGIDAQNIGDDKLAVMYKIRDPTRDGWIKEFIKQKWSSGLYWAVGGAEKKKY